MMGDLFTLFGWIQSFCMMLKQGPFHPIIKSYSMPHVDRPKKNVAQDLKEATCDRLCTCGRKVLENITPSLNTMRGLST